MKKFITKIKRTQMNIGMIAAIAAFTLASCDYSYELPETGSIPDETPPIAAFTYAQGTTETDYKVYSFSNISSSSTDYLWDFGDGTTSTETEPIHEFAAEETYTVTLTSSDKLEVTSTHIENIEVIKPEVTGPFVPEVLEPGFDKGNDSRDPWRNSDLGGVLQITSSSSFNGGYAGKFPNSNDRVAYQELEVTPNSDYVLTYYYSLDALGAGRSITVSVLATPTTLTDPAQVLPATIESHVGELSTQKSDLIKVDINFNSGANAKIAIYVDNAGDKTGYVDDFSIAAKE
jgi:PKD repeat protein